MSVFGCQGLCVLLMPDVASFVTLKIIIKNIIKETVL